MRISPLALVHHSDWHPLELLVLPVLALFIAAQGILGAQAPSASQHAGDYARADIEQGYRLFGTLCAACHGNNGDAIATANLRGGQFQRAKSDMDLQNVIRRGIAGTPMPPHDTLTNAELTALVAFLRNMRDFDSGRVVLGDKARGRVIFDGKGACVTCHRVAGKGSRSAPDLTSIGTKRTPADIERSLLDPTRSMLPANRSIRAIDKDGKIITGRRLNEDTFTIQIIDEAEKLLSIEKATLREYEVLKTSRMPSYKERLTQPELADLVAYLASLKGL